MKTSIVQNTAVIADLKKQHTALLVEQEELVTEVPRLSEHWRSFPNVWNHLGHTIGSPESRAAMEAASSAAARARAIPGELERIEQKVAHLERVARIETVKAESKQIMADSTTALEALERKQLRLNESIETFQKESEQSLEKARQTQKNATDLYAASVSSDDSSAAKAALSELQKSSKSLAAANDQSEQQGLLITALQTELVEIEAQMAAAQQQKADARRALLSAMELETEEELNVLAERMAAVGARKIALVRDNFGYEHSNGLSKIDIPRFGLISYSLGYRELNELASKISVTDLLAE